MTWTTEKWKQILSNPWPEDLQVDLSTSSRHALIEACTQMSYCHLPKLTKVENATSAVAKAIHLSTPPYTFDAVIPVGDDQAYSLSHKGQRYRFGWAWMGHDCSGIVIASEPWNYKEQDEYAKKHGLSYEQLMRRFSELYHLWAWKFNFCEHSFSREKLGNCYYSYTCSKCNYSFLLDSSG